MRSAASILAIALAMTMPPRLAGSAQTPTDADRAAALVVRWQQIVYPQFEDSRASLAEEISDMVNALLSQGAVRAIHDRVDAPGLAKIDGAVRRLAAAMVKAGVRRSDGSVVVDAESYEKALDASCPLYPFCDR